MTEIAIEPFESIVDELRPITERHWKEIALNQDKIKLAVDFNRYIKLDELGYLSVVTARDDGKLIGYCFDFVSAHLHYSNDIFAVNDVIYVDEDYRGKSVGIRMIKFVKKRLVDKGVSVWHIHSKEHSPISALLEKLGFSRIEGNYGIYLGGK